MRLIDGDKLLHDIEDSLDLKVSEADVVEVTLALQKILNQIKDSPEVDDMVSRKTAMESITKEYNRRHTGDGLRLAWIEKALYEA